MSVLICDDSDCWRDAETWTLMIFYKPDGTSGSTHLFSRCKYCGPPSLITGFQNSYGITLDEAKVWEVMRQ